MAASECEAARAQRAMHLKCYTKLNCLMPLEKDLRHVIGETTINAGQSVISLECFEYGITFGIELMPMQNLGWSLMVMIMCWVMMLRLFCLRVFIQSFGVVQPRPKTPPSLSNLNLSHLYKFILSRPYFRIIRRLFNKT